MFFCVIYCSLYSISISVPQDWLGPFLLDGIQIRRRWDFLHQSTLQSAAANLWGVAYTYYFTDVYVDLLKSAMLLTGTVKTQQVCVTSGWGKGCDCSWLDCTYMVTVWTWFRSQVLVTQPTNQKNSVNKVVDVETSHRDCGPYRRAAQQILKGVWKQVLWSNFFLFLATLLLQQLVVYRLTLTAQNSAGRNQLAGVMWIKSC